MIGRRATGAAREEGLDTVSAEVRARGLSLGRMLRRSRRARLATLRAEASIALADEAEPVAARPFRTA